MATNMTFKTNLVPDNTGSQKELGSSVAKWQVYGDLIGNADTATKINITETSSPSSGGSKYYLTYASGVSGDQNLKASQRSYIWEDANTTYAVLGDGGKMGGITLYSARNTYYANIKPTSVNASRNWFLPNTSGWLVTAGNGSSTGAGSENIPVFINTSGVATAITKPLPTGNARIFYGTCGTAAATATKEVTCASYDALTAGDILVVKFSNANTAAVADLKLNVNNKGAKAIKKHYNATVLNNLNAANTLTNSVHVFTFDGTNWLLIDSDYNTNTLLRTYATNTNIDVPLIASSSASSTTAAWSEYTSTSKDWYGVIPNSSTTRATINLSSGKMTVPGGINISKQGGIRLTDHDGLAYGGIFDNGTNLWIGASASDGHHHVGQTLISTGYDSKGVGNKTLKIAIPTKSDSGETAATKLVSYFSNSTIPTNAIIIGSSDEGTGAVTASDVYLDQDGLYKHAAGGPFVVEAGGTVGTMLALKAGMPQMYSYIDISDSTAQGGITISTRDSGADITLQSANIINLNGKITLKESISYGTALPSSGTEGQIFFQFVN